VDGSTWHLYNVKTRGAIRGGLKYGGCKDIPVAGDYNADGADDLALYRQDCAEGSTWHIYDLRDSEAILGNHKYGGCKDIPAASTV
jgi:hypothetical protein